MDFHKKEELKKWGLFGAVALAAGAMTVDTIQKRNEAALLTESVRRNIQELNLPGQVQCSYSLATCTTECLVDFRNQTADPRLRQCYIKMDCKTDGDTHDCRVNLRGDDAKTTCERILDEASGKSKI